ncbi:RNA polymerase sigma factor SigJ [Schumannella luteola]|uniref:RNA polymerase sigma-70 factor (ECF subfamily) n=1 Tax=Schumannella luteola TaxID=472059 RepID=A0A852YI23_9MICO|nr:RNA polymerase sigma factor SigJ [Schumannella luteola]NYG97429.1 RNA polymerase sigma-70 factor (ECF subfamily) [Schumannella luteola]TPX01673.1 sigma-70 family RNA polymerase sigma factor [Schumannella luteola]
MTHALADVIAERRRLVAIGYRMLGTLAEAEDAVQETYARWYRLDEAERAAVRVPAAWLTRVMSRVCLDVLGSARARRERYVGEWLPEPVPADLFSGISTSTSPEAARDPLDRVTLDEQVSTALLIVMESMTPAERVAFVLHDVFAVPFDEIAETVGRSSAAVRQLASSARRRVRDEGTIVRERHEHDRVVAAFSAACASGDLDALMRILDPTVVLRSDGGGIVSAARRPVIGADNVARFLLGLVAKRSDLTVDFRRTGDGTALILLDGGQLLGLANLRVHDGLVTDVWMQLNPEKLTAWSMDD